MNTPEFSSSVNLPEDASKESNPFYYEGCDAQDAQTVYSIHRLIEYIDRKYGNGRQVTLKDYVTRDEEGTRCWTALQVIVGSYFDRHPAQQDMLFPLRANVSDRTNQRVEYVREPLNPIAAARKIVGAYRDTKIVLDSLK